MKTICLRAAMVLAMVGLGGCSGSDVSEVSELPTGETLAAASINPPPALGPITPSTTTGPNGATEEASNKVEPFRNPFAPPKDPPPPPVVEQPEPEPEPVPEPAPEIRPPGTPPKIRLLGFMNIGEPKVLVAYRDELQTLAIGDTLEDMEVIGIESPDLTMLFEEREIKLSLFDQAWEHEGGPASAGHSSSTQTRPRSSQPSRNASTSPSSGAVTSGGTVTSSGTAASGIPGFEANAGKPPGFQPPLSPGTGSTPEDSIGSPPPGLPGLGSETSGGELPRVPGLDVGGNPGPGSFPAFPSGA